MKMQSPGQAQAIRTVEWEPDLVSVVMPAYNAEATLAESVASVVAQSRRLWELIIIDDNSRDGTLQLAHRLAAGDTRIRVLPLATNGGVANARSQGILAARGRYIAFLDSDDLWLPEKLQIQVEFMQKTGAAFTFAEYRRFTPAGSLSKPIPVPARVTYGQLLKGNVIGCLTVMVDRAQSSDPTMPSIRHEDYVTWLRLLREGVTAYGISRDLARYRVAAGSVSADKRKAAGWTWNIYRNVEGLSFVRSSWCFLNYLLRAVYVRFAH